MCIRKVGKRKECEERPEETVLKELENRRKSMQKTPAVFKVINANKKC